MPRKHVFIVLSYLLMMFVWVPVVSAQGTSDINFDDIVAAVGPRSGQDLIWDIFLYLIFFVALVNMFLIPDKQLMVTILNFIVMGFAVVSKLLVGNGTLLEVDELPVLVLNVGMFVIPLIMAGALRNVGKKPPNRWPSIIMGLLGGGYFFLFWALEQRMA